MRIEPLAHHYDQKVLHYKALLIPTLGSMRYLLHKVVSVLSMLAKTQLAFKILVSSWRSENQAAKACSKLKRFPSGVNTLVSKEARCATCRVVSVNGLFWLWLSTMEFTDVR